jgi:hypothetical protein
LILAEFLENLKGIQSDEELLDFCRKNVIHGTPNIFDGREGEYYEFRKRIAQKFEIDFNEVFIAGSAKLGFSPHKRKAFDLESDVDVAIISPKLYDKISDSICSFQLELRRNRRAISVREMAMYHKYLEYTALGWIRPDMLPVSFQVRELKDDWFAFFLSISYGKSEAGNYKVNAGAFKSYNHFERYTMSGLQDLKNSIRLGN